MCFEAEVDGSGIIIIFLFFLVPGFPFSCYLFYIVSDVYYSWLNDLFLYNSRQSDYFRQGIYENCCIEVIRFVMTFTIRFRAVIDYLISQQLVKQ